MRLALTEFYKKVDYIYILIIKINYHEKQLITLYFYPS